MAKPTKHKHTYRNGTTLTLLATPKGLRIHWKPEGAEKRHPAFTVSWDKVEELKSALAQQALQQPQSA